MFSTVCLSQVKTYFRHEKRQGKDAVSRETEKRIRKRKEMITKRAWPLFGGKILWCRLEVVVSARWKGRRVELGEEDR